MNFDNALASILEDYAQPGLCPKLWDDEDLRPKIITKLCEIAEDFAEEYDIDRDYIQDVIFTGSLANYNWTEHSDIDLHLVVHFSQIHDDTEFAAAYYKLAKAVWNNDHDIQICGHEVELYVQDATEKHYSTGVYSLWDEDWLVKPKKGSGATPDKKQVDDKAEGYITQIDNLETLADEEGTDVSEEVQDLKEKIRTMRKSGLQEGGEYSLENLVFKKLRNEGHLQRLSGLRKKAYDTRMSVEECPTD
jgi:predicted nucleotidyltransferase